MALQIRTYITINLILIGVIATVFVYSAVFSYEGSNYPIKSLHKKLTGEETLSTGLSRSFSAIVQLEFEIAHQFNPYGLRVFSFFLEQLIIRISLVLMTIKFAGNIKLFWLVDSALSIVLFIIHFWPFIIGF